MGVKRPFEGRDVHVVLPLAAYNEVVALAQANRRTVTAELTLAVECYLEQAVRGSQRHAELAGKPGWMREAQKEVE